MRLLTIILSLACVSTFALDFTPEEIKQMKEEAEQGNSVAQGALGACYTVGIGVPKDEEQAVKWYRKAAEQGDFSAQTSLAGCYLQ